MVLDEPTSALDMSVQAQIVDLLRESAGTVTGWPICSSATTLKVVRALSDELIVMRDGKVVEQGSARKIFRVPGTGLHPGADGGGLRSGRPVRKAPSGCSSRIAARPRHFLTTLLGYPYYTRVIHSGIHMASQAPEIEDLVHRDYEHGFVTDVEADTVPPGLDEDVIRLISRKKREPAFLLELAAQSPSATGSP